MAREYSPLRGQSPDPNSIPCRTCRNRDRTKINLNGRTIETGITKDNCGAYTGVGVFKPHDVLFTGASCQFYEPEEE